VELATARLRLRDFTDDDWPAVLAYQSDPRYLRYYAWTGRTEPEVRAFVGRFVAQQAEQPRQRFQLAVVLPGAGRLIGNAGVRRDPERPWEAELGYELAPDFWGRGYATEMAGALLAFAFGELHVHRLAAHCVADNTASARVLEKLGFRLEGRLRDQDWYKGRWWDLLCYGLLEAEWEARYEP
jgi:RimJ/RimL family protein N-acetyltransferase